MRASTLLALLPMAMAAPSTSPMKRESPAPVLVPRGAELIEGKYIVRMKKDSITAAVAGAVSKIASDADYTYTNKFKGFAATLTDEEVKELQKDPNVSAPSPSDA